MLNHKYPSSLNTKVNIHGPGITEIQAALIENFILNGIEEYKDDKFNNAVYIQDLIENSNDLGGKWIVEIVDKSTDGKWAYAGETERDSWMILMDFGEYEWTYNIWTPSC